MASSTTEVVRGRAIGAEDDKVVELLGVEGHLAVDGVVDDDVSAVLGHLDAQDVGLAGLDAAAGLLGIKIAAAALIALEGVLALLSGLAVGVELLLGAEAGIGLALVPKLLGGMLVQVQALGLGVGSKVATHLGTLVPVQAQPTHGAQDDLRVLVGGAGGVGVVDAQDERAAGVPGDEPGVKGGAQIAHVHIAGGRGGKPGADLPLWDLGLHLLKILHIQSHVVPSIAADVLPLFYWYYRCFPAIWQGPERSPAPLLPSPARRGGPLFLFLAEKQFWKCSLQNSQAAAALIG